MIYNSLSWEDCRLQDAFSWCYQQGEHFCSHFLWTVLGEQSRAFKYRGANSWVLNLSSAPQAPPSGILQTVWRETSLNISRKRRHRDDTTLDASGVTPALLFFTCLISMQAVRTQAPCWGRELWFAWPQIHLVLMVAGVKIWLTSHSQKEADKAKQKKKSFQDFPPRNKAALYKNG